MKIVAILGSPHGMNGNTAKVLQPLVDGAEAAGSEVTLIDLSRVRIESCIGCDVCHITGTCALKDDFNAVLAEVQSADAIVLASPNYICSVSAQLKAFFDRCCGPIHLFAWNGKYGAAVASSGGGSCDEVEAYMLRFLRMVGCQTVGSIGAEAYKIFDPEQMMQVEKNAAALGKKLVEATAQNEYFAEQAAELAANKAMMKQVVEWGQERWAYEWATWQARGDA